MIHKPGKYIRKKVSVEKKRLQKKNSVNSIRYVQYNILGPRDHNILT